MYPSSVRDDKTFRPRSLFGACHTTKIFNVGVQNSCVAALNEKNGEFISFTLVNDMRAFLKEKKAALILDIVSGELSRSFQAKMGFKQVKLVQSRDTVAAVFWFQIPTRDPLYHYKAGLAEKNKGIATGGIYHDHLSANDGYARGALKI